MFMQYFHIDSKVFKKKMILWMCTLSKDIRFIIMFTANEDAIEKLYCINI